MKFENGKVLVSKADCKVLRLVMGCNSDLIVKLGARYVNEKYGQAQLVTKCMFVNHLWLSCNADERNNLLNDRKYQFDLIIKMLKGDYDYE